MTRAAGYSLFCLLLAGLLAAAMMRVGSGPVPQRTWRPTATWTWQPVPVLPTDTPCPPLVRIAQTRAHVTATPLGTVTPTCYHLWPTDTPVPGPDL